MSTFPTIEQIREALGIEAGDATLDDEIAAMLASTIAMIESYLGRGIAYAPELQEFDPPDSGNPALMLWRFPVDTVNAVETLDELGVVAGVALTGWRLQRQSGILRWRSGCLCVPVHYCHTAPSIRVDYVGGYADDAWPADLLDAVMSVFYARWAGTQGTGNPANAAALGGSVRGVSVDGLTVNYDSASYAGTAFAGVVVPPELVNVAASLDPYRQRFLAGV